MVVILDASTTVGAALKNDSIPRSALLAARERHTIALSVALFAEIEEVLTLPKFASSITAEVRADIIGLLTAAPVWVGGDGQVEDCRDRKDNEYLELAAHAGARLIVSHDEDLLILDPWRRVRSLPRQARV